MRLRYLAVRINPPQRHDESLPNTGESSWQHHNPAPEYANGLNCNEIAR
jgi:hypothetical protein